MQSVHTACFVDRASRNIRVKETNLMHCLSAVYFVNQPLHFSGVFIAHHQEVHRIYTTISTDCSFYLTACSDWTRTTDSQRRTSWWWAVNMPETRRGWLSKCTEDKECIQLGFFTRIFILHLENPEVYSVFGRDIAAFPVNIITHGSWNYKQGIIFELKRRCIFKYYGWEWWPESHPKTVPQYWHMSVRM
jgi:hypothetical protein